MLAAAASAYGTVFEGTGLDFACLEACPCFDQEAINTATFTAAASQDYTELTALVAVFTDCSVPCAVTCSQAASAVCREQTAINGWEFMDAGQKACAQEAGSHCAAMQVTYTAGTVGVGNCVANENDGGGGGGGGCGNGGGDGMGGCGGNHPNAGTGGMGKSEDGSGEDGVNNGSGEDGAEDGESGAAVFASSVLSAITIVVALF